LFDGERGAQRRRALKRRVDEFFSSPESSEPDFVEPEFVEAADDRGAVTVGSDGRV
jgi:hypothetical protein